MTERRETGRIDGNDDDLRGHFAFQPAGAQIGDGVFQRTQQSADGEHPHQERRRKRSRQAAVTSPGADHFPAGTHGADSAINGLTKGRIATPLWSLRITADPLVLMT